MSEEIKNPENNQTENQQKADKEQKVIFVVSRHKQAFEMLKSPRMALRATLMMAFFVLALFVGLTILTLVLKSKFPYSTIRSNEYGAFLMETENSEISNFEFNTAEFFANSGVEVETGDEIRIKASGNFNPSIQHLAENNINAKWLDANGAEPTDKRDITLRNSMFFLAPNVTPEKLLCVVLDGMEEKKLNDFINKQYELVKNEYECSPDSTEFKNRNEALNKFFAVITVNKNGNENVFEIGRENHFMAGKDGKLFFVINDIIFTDSILAKIGNIKNIDSIWPCFKNDEKNRFEKCPDAWYLDNVGSLLVTIEKRKNSNIREH